MIIFPYRFCVWSLFNMKDSNTFKFWIPFGSKKTISDSSFPSLFKIILELFIKVKIRRLFKSKMSTFLLILVAIISIGLNDLEAQKIEKLEQAANGTISSINDPVEWISGNLNAAKAHYTECMVIPYHLEIINLVPGTTYSVTIGWDTKKGGKNAIDYITSYDYTGNHSNFGHNPEVINPLANTALFETSPSMMSVSIPEPSSEGSSGIGLGQPTLTFRSLAAINRQMRIFNGTISSISYVNEGSLALGTTSSTLKVNFKVNGGQSTVVLAWGGHIAAQNIWGFGNSASNINGSPYHTFIDACINLSGCGNKDVQLQTSAVYEPPLCEVKGTTIACTTDSNLIYEVPTNNTNGEYIFKWTISNNTSGASIVGSSTNSSVVVNPGSSAGSFLINVKISKPLSEGSLSSECFASVTVKKLTCSITKNKDFENLCDPVQTKPGSATVYPTGGSGNYTYLWSNGEKTKTAINLPIGISTVTVTQTSDGNNMTNECSTECLIEIFEIGEPCCDSPTITCPADKTIECDVSTNPSITGVPLSIGACGTITFSRADVISNGKCPGEYTITRKWTATDAKGKTNNCNQLISVFDTKKPVITSNNKSGYLGCSPNIITPTFSGIDNCSGIFAPIVTTSGKTKDNVGNAKCNNFSQTWYANYTDDCGNVGIQKSVTYTWTEDSEVPVIKPNNQSRDLGCNPSIVPPTFTATDNCLDVAVNLTPTTSGKKANGKCGYVQTWTANYTDKCLNKAAEVSVTYTWTEDLEIPIITASDQNRDLGYNPEIIPPSFSVKDNCLDATFNVIPTTIGAQANGECRFTQTWTANYTDKCLNKAAKVSVTYTWTVNSEIPKIIASDQSRDLGCNPNIQPPTFSVSENCADATINVIPVTAGAQSNGTCGFTQTWTANFTDKNLKKAAEVSITYTWTEDLEIPVITASDQSRDLGCNPSFLPPTFYATDNCLDATLNVVPTNSGPSNYGCFFAQTWTANYTDKCLNKAVEQSVTYTWTEDLVVPIIIASDQSRDLGYSPDIKPPTFSTYDNCLDATLNLLPATSGPSNDGCSFTQTWSANYTDNCLNKAAEVSVTYTWSVNSQDAIIIASDHSRDLGCNPNIIPPKFYAAENCFDVTVNVVPTTIGPENNGCSYSQTWTARHEGANSNNVVEKSVTYTWTEDLEIPVITQLTGAEDGTYFGCNPVVAPTFKATDNCLDVSVSVLPTTTGPSHNGCSYTQTWIANYTDNCLNKAAEVSVTYTWTEDKDEPIITFVNPILKEIGNGGTLKVQCYGQDPNWSLPEASIYDVSVFGGCQGEVDLVVSEVVVSEGDCSSDGYIEKFKCSWTANNGCGNAITLFIYMEVVDTISPIIIGVPTDITVSCDNLPGAPNLKAIDECLCADIEMTESLLTSECLNGQVIERTWTAYDCCGNVTIATQTITLIDNVAPSLKVTLPDGTEIYDNKVLEFDCNIGGIPSNFLGLSVFSAEATEGCSGTPEVTFNSNTETSNNCNDGALEVHTFVWAANDACLNTSSITLKIKVIDTVPPIIMNLEDQICDNGDGLPFIYAIDNCSNAYLQYFDVEIEGGCGTEFKRIYLASDACGNTIEKEQIIIREDHIAPEIVLTNPLFEGIESGDTIEMEYNLQTNGNFTNFSINDAQFKDECNLALTTSYTEELMLGLDCKEGNTKALIKMTWSAEDACENISQISIYALLNDTQAPVISNFKAEFTTSCAKEIPNVIITDNSGKVTSTIDETIIPGDCPGNYLIIRVIHAEDECGNVLNESQKIHIIDILGPVIEGVEPYVCEDLSIPNVSAFDACSSEMISVAMVQDTVQKENCEPSMLIRRIWSATDLCGNTTEIEQIISINDVTPPELIYNNNIVPFLNSETEVMLSDVKRMLEVNSIEWYNIISYDACVGEVVRPEFTETSEFTEICSESGYLEMRTFHWDFVDVCGNKSTVEFKVKIVDDVAPIMINVPQSADYGCLGMPEIRNLNSPEFGEHIDSMSGSIAFIQSEEMINGIMVMTNIWTATDACGNVTQVLQQLTEIVHSDLSSSISAANDILCNSHNNLVTANTEGGEGPFSYEWTIESKDCQIQGGQGTKSIEVYVGFHSTIVKLKVTDANQCESYSEYEINCIAKGGINRSENYPLEGEIFISNISPNPTADRIVMSIISHDAATIQYTILNTMNERILTNKVNITESESNIIVDVNDFSPGIYYILIDNGRSTDIKRFMKI